MRLESVRILRLLPGDEIVLNATAGIGSREAETLRREAEARWPNHRVTILSAGIEMTVVRAEPPTMLERRA